MKTQKIRFADGSVSWTVLGDDLLPIKPIQRFISHLYLLDRSPNTQKSYSYHLMLFWQFISDQRPDWEKVTIEDLAKFVHWLRMPADNVIAIHESSALRSESTINTILAAVTSFYQYHEDIGTNLNMVSYYERRDLNPKFKSFFHHLNKENLVTYRKIKLKTVSKLPKTLTTDQIEDMLALCRSKRDQFLVMLLHETGMRIGQALGLYHCDVKTWDNEIHIIPRNNHKNLARAKSPYTNVVHVRPALMALYTDYIINEYEDIDGDYVFVVLKKAFLGRPLSYYAVQHLFERFSRQLGFSVHPHMFRHTHATSLIRSGWDMALVMKRLGHQNIQTTINTYVHLTNQDLKEALTKFHKGEPS